MGLRDMICAGSVAAMLLSTMPLQAQEDASAAAAKDPQAVADRIAQEVAQIRGLPFKQPVGVENQSTDDFRAYISRQIDATVPESISRHYGKIVRTLGLYRGPEVGDFSAMMTGVMASQVGAYYDPARQRFYVVMSGMPELMQGVLYSHELYHALQDQHFGLARYMAARRDDPSHNSDGVLARQAVVEGEATYMMNLWMMRTLMKSDPPRQVVAKIVDAQTNMSMDQIREMLKQPQVAQLVGDDVRNAMQSAREIPPFILDRLLGAYLKGLGFVFVVHEQGWPAVEKLYTESPPQSTEHVLHPEKWRAHEAPVMFEWPDFTKTRQLGAWELLDDDVLGEFQWRTVFKEHGLAAEAESAAAGWGGDRYAVFKRKDSDATLLLLRTSWDTEADAREFVDAYRRVLAVKYADAPTAARVVQKGLDVFVAEGGTEAGIAALLKVVRSARKKRS